MCCHGCGAQSRPVSSRAATRTSLSVVRDRFWHCWSGDERREMLFQVHASEDADGRRLNSQPADKISYSSPLQFFPSNVVCIYDTVSQTRRAFKVENLNANITSSFGINQASTSLKYPHQNGIFNVLDATGDNSLNIFFAALALSSIKKFSLRNVFRSECFWVWRAKVFIIFFLLGSPSENRFLLS